MKFVHLGLIRGYHWGCGSRNYRGYETIPFRSSSPCSLPFFYSVPATPAAQKQAASCTRQPHAGAPAAHSQKPLTTSSGSRTEPTCELAGGWGTTRQLLQHAERTMDTTAGTAARRTNNKVRQLSGQADGGRRGGGGGGGGQH